MDPKILEATHKALLLVLILSLPPIIVASVMGILISFLQAITQVQEQTISFAVKLIFVFITILLTGSWLGGELYNYSMRIFTEFPMLK
ncbi:MAG: type III secretion system export apparatus subunit SctS [Desulfobacterales bacterium]|nr:type III secretion system export apparatus subunit SctS [Desulfobacterales bacterium]